MEVERAPCTGSATSALNGCATPWMSAQPPAPYATRYISGQYRRTVSPRWSRRSTRPRGHGVGRGVSRRDVRFVSRFVYKLRRLPKTDSQSGCGKVDESDVQVRHRKTTGACTPARHRQSSQSPLNLYYLLDLGTRSSSSSSLTSRLFALSRAARSSGALDANVARCG